MLKTDVLVIGGSAAGFVSATTVKSNNKEKSVTLVRAEEKVMIPCGIPYIFGTIGTSDKNVLPDKGLNNLGVDIIVDTVTKVDTKKKIASTSAGKEISYDKLILGTGSEPIMPKWLKGRDKENVFIIPKNKVYLDAFHEKVKDLKNILVIGAGFIGVEIADELNKKGFNVTLVEIMPNILGSAFDEEFAESAKENLEQRGITVKTDVGIKEVLGDKKVSGALLNDDSVIDADAVILSLGYSPNSKLAKEMGLEINSLGFIKTDQYKRTSQCDIFAAGDCSEKREFSTGKLSRIMLASTACAEARVAGLNLFSLSTVSTFRGTIGIYSTSIGDTAYGVAGLTEDVAKKEGFDVICASFTGMDTHPGCLDHTHKQTVKLIVSKKNGVILGGEAMGGRSVGELTNVIGFIIQNNMTINNLLVAQIGTQPMLTASPAGYPLIKAAEMIAKQF